jgi:hypothetical protein
LRALPETPFEPCDKRPAKASSTALARYRMNDYSAPTPYGFRDVLVKGFVDEVAIICGAAEIARHPRVYWMLGRSPMAGAKRSREASRFGSAPASRSCSRRLASSASQACS